MVLCTLTSLEYFMQDAWQFLGAVPTSFSSLFTSCWNLPSSCILSSVECCLYKLYESSIWAGLQKYQGHVLKEKHKNVVCTCIEWPCSHSYKNKKQPKCPLGIFWFKEAQFSFLLLIKGICGSSCVFVRSVRNHIGITLTLAQN